MNKFGYNIIVNKDPSQYHQLFVHISVSCSINHKTEVFGFTKLRSIKCTVWTIGLYNKLKGAILAHLYQPELLCKKFKMFLSSCELDTETVVRWL